MQQFLCLLKPIRPDLSETMTPEEEQVFAEHFTYLKDAHAKGVLQLAGPCTDYAFGLVLYQAQDLADARQFMANDPTVSANLMTAEVHPFRISIHRLSV